MLVRIGTLLNLMSKHKINQYPRKDFFESYDKLILE